MKDLVIERVGSNVYEFLIRNVDLASEHTLVVSTSDEFNIANKATPTSANTASHMVANPPAPNINTRILTVIAKLIFCHTIFLVCLPIIIAIGILLGLSS